MNANGTSTKEDFKIIKFIEDNTLFTMLLGKPWIKRDQDRKKEEEKVLEQQRQELTDFMTRRIAQLIEEQENRSKPLIVRGLDVEAERMSEDSQNTKAHVPEKEESLPLGLRRESQQHEVPMLKKNKNQNGKRIPETKLTGKKARKLSKRRANINRLHNISEGTSQNEKLVEIELHRDIRPTT